MRRKHGSGRGGANAPGGGPVSRVVASSPVPLSPAAVLAAALHATRMATTAHGPSPAQVEMVLAALEFSAHVPSPPADVRDRLLACRRSCGSSSLLDGVLAAAVSSLAGGVVDAVKREGKFVVMGLKAHGCRGHDDSQVATAPVTIGSLPRDDIASSACCPAKHGPPLHCAESPPPPQPSESNFFGKGKGAARPQAWRIELRRPRSPSELRRPQSPSELRRPRSPSPRRLGSPDRQVPRFSRRTRDYPTAGGASRRSRSSSPARSRQRTRSPARPDGGANILWFPRRTLGHFKALPLDG